MPGRCSSPWRRGWPVAEHPTPAMKGLLTLCARAGEDPTMGTQLTLCASCWQALCTDLAALFAPVEGRRGAPLEATCVCGFTFTAGAPETCALHEFFHDGARCTEGV